MSPTQLIIQKIDLLPPTELEVVYQEVAKRMSHISRATKLLAKYRGKGQGIWSMDAQEYVQQLRQNTRG
ncbi:hypothetical protein MTX78_09025 [Hymenobacter tibetensis]|uniref:Uncharacterized protein n=1 Tax=Hymenobacter tibetensis TaxID=497967 RepID=A0ABY4D2U3_9BACT|nr:hypothetical protein [Hymenobacter tibetensis]UOG76730.1 hypothetical protein MTX78_09025 [Hymenobacter tibetensis]